LDASTVAQSSWKHPYSFSSLLKFSENGGKIRGFYFSELIVPGKKVILIILVSLTEHCTSHLMSCNCTSYNILGLSTGQYFLFWMFIFLFNRNNTWSVKHDSSESISSLHAASQNQLKNRTLATRLLRLFMESILLCYTVILIHEQQFSL
jgi:hypothetical protein